MSETAPKTELMRSLGRLVRGLSALFWGLPIALVVCVQTANTGWLDSLGRYGLIAPVAVTALLFYGLHLISDFQKQERIWMLALDRTKILGLVNMGLSPFLHWHQHLQSVVFMLRVLDNQWLLAILIFLLPLAITMSLIWKIKEAILASVFGPEH